MIQKRVDEIDKATIDALVTDKVSERRTLDYKELLPGPSDDEKREFLSDVASFANASGGDIVYGVVDERDGNGRATGIPSSVEGLSVTNIGEYKGRLEASARDGIAPRIQGIQFQPVDGFGKGPVLIMRIPKSWIGPHMVTFKNLSRFYSRNSTGKYQLDVGEIRAAFIESTSIGERLRGFRAERLAKAVEGETAVPLRKGVKMLFHMIPLSSVSPGVLRDVTGEASKFMDALKPIQGSAYGGYYNLDGFYVAGGSKSYVQVFRSGAIEAGEGELFPDSDKTMPSLMLEHLIIRTAERFLNALQELAMPLPIVAMLTFIDVKGYSMAVPRELFLSEHGIIDRNLLALPEIMFEDYDRSNIARDLQPLFDSLWQASGISRSPYYDEKGNRLR